MIDALPLAQELVRCRSVTPADGGAQGVLRTVLEPAGFTCRDLPFGEVRNLFARAGTGAPHLCFAGHTDVVPPGDEAAWRHPPFAGIVADGRLHGRGAADMKGAIACFAAAAGAFVKKHGTARGSISLLITGDEEGPAIDGTVRVLEWMAANGQVPDAALVGEPSNPKALGDEIKIGRRGSLNGALTVRGVAGHVAYPDLADNPLPRLVAQLGALAHHKFDDGTKHFQPTNLELTAIDVGNPASNVIPAAGSARFNVRFNDRWNAATIEREIRRVLDAHNVAYALETQSNAESFLTAPGAFTALVQDAVRDVTGRIPALTTNGGTSDARFITRLCPVVEFGLINETIHKVDEYVALDDLDKLTNIYGRVLERFFIGGPS